VFISISASGSKERVKSEIYAKVSDKPLQEALAVLVDHADGDACSITASLANESGSGSVHLSIRSWKAARVK
jgi:hypothetical protein